MVPRRVPQDPRYTAIIVTRKYYHPVPRLNLILVEPVIIVIQFCHLRDRPSNFLCAHANPVISSL
jgi:hypothetical protein